MIYRIISILVLLAVLGYLFVSSEDSNKSQPQVQQNTDEDKAIKGLKIN